MKHNTLTKIITLALAVVLALSLAACGSKTDDSGDKTDAPVIKIGVPNDTTNEARALLLLQENGIIKLKDGAGITATKNDIVENPYNVEIVEAEAAQLPNMLPDLDYAVINSNYAINAGLNPVNDSLLIEGSASAYANILAVKEGNESAQVVALKAALESKQVADFIAEKYAGSVISVVENPTDGYSDFVDYDALKGETITIAASPTPHAEILEVVKEILAAKDITLDIQVYNDYVVPNTVVDDGTVTANYFQHLPYLEDFNAQNGTHIASVAAIHVEPMGLYGGKQTTLDALRTSAQKHKTTGFYPPLPLPCYPPNTPAIKQKTPVFTPPLPLACPPPCTGGVTPRKQDNAKRPVSFPELPPGRGGCRKETARIKQKRGTPS